MKPKTIILMVVAVACGLAASYMTSRVIADRNRQSDTPEEKVTILVAAKKIPYSTLIKDPHKYFAEKQYTKGEEPKKAIKSWEQVQDKRLNKALSEDQFVTLDDLLDPKTAGSIEIMLPQGMRAVALKVNAASVVAGFVLPNSRVDVVLTQKNGEHSTTKTILQNMLVLASDQMTGRQEDKLANLGSTVTVAAKPEDVEKLRLAEGIGELSLALRGSEDQEIVSLKVTHPEDLSRNRGKDAGPEGDDPNSAGGAVKAVPDAPATVAGPPAPTKPEEPPPPPPKTVTQIIYNGESVTKTIFVLGQNEVSTQVEKTGMERETRPEKKETAPPEKKDSAPPEKAPAEKASPEAAPKKDASPAAKPEGTK
jgi:pilus assembly protein CpaB